MQNSAIPDLSTAWTLSDAAGLFIMADDGAVIEALDQQIEEISYQIQVGVFDRAPWPAVQKHPAFDCPCSTSDEEAERTAWGWTSDRIQRWVYSRYAWLSEVGHYPHLFSEVEVMEGALRDDWSREYAWASVKKAAERRRSEMEDKRNNLRYRRQRLAIKGLLSALAAGNAVAYAREGSIGEPIALLNPKMLIDDELVFDLDRRAVRRLGDDQAVVFCDVKVLPAVPVAPMKPKQSGNEADFTKLVRDLLIECGLLYAEKGMKPKAQRHALRQAAKRRKKTMDQTEDHLKKTIKRVRVRAEQARAAGHS